MSFPINTNTAINTNYSPFNNYFGLADIITQKKQKENSPTQSYVTPVSNSMSSAQQLINTAINLHSKPTTTAVRATLNPNAMPFIPSAPAVTTTTTPVNNNNTNKNDVHYRLTLQRQRAAMNHKQYSKVRFCVFCQKKGKPLSMQKSHRLRDGTGCVECPYLRRTVCQQCGATGDDAHTIKYCPINQPKIVFT